jgi:AcrR family transcriptional regulator
MGARAEATARTRQQIIDAAARQIRVSPEPLVLAGVAARAGVSRTTLYRHFASVTELLDAVATDLLARARFDRLLAALELGDPVEALRQVIVAGTAIWAIDTTLVRNLFCLARAQPEATPVIGQLERGRVTAMEHLALRLHQAGRLRDGLARARAVDLLMVITAFAAWDELVTARNRPAATATAAVADLAVRAVVKDRWTGAAASGRDRH